MFSVQMHQQVFPMIRLFKYAVYQKDVFVAYLIGCETLL